MRPMLLDSSWLSEWQREALSDTAHRLKAQEHGREAAPRPYERRGSVAVVPLVGMLAPGAWVEYFGGTSTEYARSAFLHAMADPDVGAVFLRVSSGGGEVAGTDELADAIYSMRGKKPIYAHVEDVGASAALWIASQADRVTANRTAMVGSYGVVAVLMDDGELLDKVGVKLHVVSTGEYKALLSEVPVSEKALEYLRGLLEPAFAAFGDDLRRGRSLDAKGLARVADGRIYGAAEAMSLGLVDAVMSREEALASATEAGDGNVAAYHEVLRRRQVKRAEEYVRRKAVLDEQARFRAWVDNGKT